jgi:O-antigen ligase
MSSDKKGVKFISFIALLVIYLGMFLSGGRKYVIMPLIFLYILMMHKGSKKGRLKIIGSTFIIAIAALVVYFLIMKVPFFYNVIGVRFEGFFEFLGDNRGKADSSTLLRYQMIDAAWEKWLERPLFGYGFDSFKYYNEQFVTGHRYYSHNNFLELLYNQGIVGFAIYYSFYVYLVIKAWRLKNNFLYRGFIIGAVAAWLLFEYYGITYSTTPTQIMLFFCFNLINQSKNQEDLCKEEIEK